MNDELIRKISAIKPRIIGMCFVVKSQRPCEQCRLFRNRLYSLPEEQDDMPTLPLHPACQCYYEVIDDRQTWEDLKNRFEKSRKQPTVTMTFGDEMDIETFLMELTEDQQIEWCNSFRRQFNAAIQRYAGENRVPKRLLTLIIVNEMMDWDTLDGSWLDGVGGGGVGYAQISLDTAIKFKITGLGEPQQDYFENISWQAGAPSQRRDYRKEYRTRLHQKLRTVDGSVEIAAKLLKIYLDTLSQKAEKGKLGSGYMTSSLHSGATHAILSAGNDVVALYPPKWLIWTTVAMWNSGLEILDAKDKIQEGNYTNAFRHGENALELVKFLPILVK